MTGMIMERYFSETPHSLPEQIRFVSARETTTYETSRVSGVEDGRVLSIPHKSPRPFSRCLRHDRIGPCQSN